jgi:hypothetical protein
MHRKVSLIVIVATLITFAAITYVAITLVNIDPEKVRNSNSPVSRTVSEREKKEIDEWIIKENLNPYGEAYDTVYTGGTPLFNETTGEKKDRYLYIIEKHPDKPWLK